MALNLAQKDDGSAELRSDGAVTQGRWGGPSAPAGSQVSYRGEVIVKVPLAAVDTGGGLFSWQVPLNTDIIITGLYLDVTTASTGACTVDIGYTASSATTSVDNLIDGLDVNAATGLFSNFKNAGSNGKADQRGVAGKWVTGSKASGATAGIVGYAYIRYIPVGA